MVFLISLVSYLSASGLGEQNMQCRMDIEDDVCSGEKNSWGVCEHLHYDLFVSGLSRLAVMRGGSEDVAERSHHS